MRLSRKSESIFSEHPVLSSYVSPIISENRYQDFKKSIIITNGSLFIGFNIIFITEITIIAHR